MISALSLLDIIDFRDLWSPGAKTEAQEQDFQIRLISEKSARSGGLLRALMYEKA